MAKLSEALRSIRGMNDFLPPDSMYWEAMERTMIDLAQRYGFRSIRTPILEPTGLFARSIGEATDIVEKEMYTFIDRLNGQSLTLRPENTASCVRAFFEHGLQRSGLQRWYYMGPMFRHERPQKGRYRQFHQMGLEVLGTASVEADLELIIFSADLWQQLGIPFPRLEINSLGVASERLAYREILIKYWEKNNDVLDDTSRERLHKNPMRLLDSKNPNMYEAIKAAPTLLETLGQDSRRFFEHLCEGLKQMGISYTINPQLVRGLDYYTHTVFEWVSDDLGAQGTICGGGRYDGLAERIAQSALPACGLAIGLERLYALRPPPHIAKAANHCVYIAHEGDATVWMAMHAAKQVRTLCGWRVILHYGGGKIATQIKKAIECSCRYIIIIGTREYHEGVVSIKDLQLRDAQASEGQAVQQTVPISNIADFFQKMASSHGN